MRDSFLVFSYDSPRDSVGQSNMRSSRDEVNTRVTTVGFMRAFNRIAIELPLCVRNIREMRRVFEKSVSRDLGCRLILKYKMFDSIFFFFKIRRFEKFVYTKMSIETYLLS